MFVKGKSFGDEQKQEKATKNLDEKHKREDNAKANDTNNQKPRRKSLMRSLRNSLFGGSTHSSSNSNDVKRKMAAKKREEDRKTQAMQDDFVNFGDIEARRQVRFRSGILLWCP